MEIKATLRNSRTGSNGKLCMAAHNDRTKGGWNYPEKVEQNYYWVMQNGNPTQLKKSTFHSFEEMEREFYDKHFQKHLDLQNEKHTKAGNISRIKKDKDGNPLPASEVYLKDKKKAPMETILQVGNKDTDLDEQTRKKLTVRAFDIYINHLLNISNGSYKLLNTALHMDEETPHIHIRGVFVAKDKNGCEELAQKEAINNIKAKYPEIFENARKPMGKKGDKDLIAWTDYQRETWYYSIERVAKEMGLDIHINREVESPGAVHLEPMQYKLHNLQNDIHKLNFAIDEAEIELGGVKALTKNNCEKLAQTEYKKNLMGDCYLVPKEDLQVMQEALRELESCKILERRAGEAEQKRIKALEDAERIRKDATLDATLQRTKTENRIKALESQNKQLKKAITDYLPFKESNRILGKIEASKAHQKDNWGHER